MCDSSLLSTLCTFVRQAGLESVLAGAFWTLFAPTNEAFTNLGDALDVISADTDLLTLLVLHHVAGQVLSASDLECDGSVTMTSGASTTTVCEGDAIFQTGDANDEGFPPQIIFPDIRACNGVVHVVNEVLLPHLGEPAERTQDDCQSIGKCHV